jgi:hypothetical protein
LIRPRKGNILVINKSFYVFLTFSFQIDMETVDGLEALTPNEKNAINEKLDGLTPLHIVFNSLNLENFDQILQVIKVFIGYKANINISDSDSDSDSDSHTPFSLLLDKLAESWSERDTELLVYIIDSYGDEETIKRTLDILEKPNFGEVLKKLLDSGHLLRSAVKHGSTVCVERIRKMVGFLIMGLI